MQTELQLEEVSDITVAQEGGWWTARPRVLGTAAPVVAGACSRTRECAVTLLRVQLAAPAKFAALGSRVRAESSQDGSRIHARSRASVEKIRAGYVARLPRMKARLERELAAAYAELRKLNPTAVFDRAVHDRGKRAGK